MSVFTSHVVVDVTVFVSRVVVDVTVFMIHVVPGSCCRCEGVCESCCRCVHKSCYCKRECS